MQKKYDNLWVIGSHISLSTMEQKMAGVRDAVSLLSSALKSRDVVDFDYVVIDTPPNLGFLTLNAIVSASRLIVPLDVSLFSLNGVNQINEILAISESMGFARPAVKFLITLFDGRSNFAKNFLQRSRELFEDKLLSTVVRSNVKLRESALLGKAVFEYASSANGAVDYAALASEILPELKGKSISLETAVTDSGKSQSTFTLYAPEAGKVYVAGSFNGWAVSENCAMKKLDDGTWAIALPLPEGTHQYKFVVDGFWKEDPSNKLAESDSLGGRNSIVVVKKD
jgi:septum formation inhibitor-activating ATPase MinD